MPIRNILLATDFSTDAEAALQCALEFTKQLHAKLHVLHSYAIAVQTTPTGFIAIPEDLIASVRKEAELRLELLAKRLAETATPVQTHASIQDPVNSILQLAGSLPADLVVMGTRGLTGIKHALLGSVAERTVRLAPCPVLTVKARPA